jgi:hypothetical protein
MGFTLKNQAAMVAKNWREGSSRVKEQLLYVQLLASG